MNKGSENECAGEHAGTDRRNDSSDSSERLAEKTKSIISMQPTLGPKVRTGTTDLKEAFGKTGRYQVLGTLGQGGMGTVLKAFDSQLDRRVALKVLHRSLGSRHTNRLLREAKALAKLSHPNVVQVYEVGQIEGETFVAMELIEGRTLTQWMHQHPRPRWRSCIEVFIQLGMGLAAAHEQSLVHRDFKPDNCIIDEHGRPRVLDFGLVREMDVPPEDDVRSEANTAVSGTDQRAASLTQTGTLLGTMAYMPLEQFNGKPADARSDQFSFCVALYEALYGERPFSSRTVGPLIIAIMQGDIRRPPRGTRVPTKVRNLVLRGLLPNPDDRWPTMEALLTELHRVVAPAPRKWSLLLGGGLAVVGMGLWEYLQPDITPPCEGAQALIVTVWNADRRQSVKHAILNTNLPYASDTWERIEQRLDDYSGAWADKRTEVCEATSVRQEQSAEVMDLRMSCLREHRVALRETVSVLTEATPTRLAQAVTLVESLPRLSRCDDLDALQAELPPPTDPQQAETVETLRDQIAQIRALRNAGAYDEALTGAQALVEQAEEVDHPPLLAEALMERGSCRQEKAEYEGAEEDLEQAYLLATQLEHSAVEANAVRKLAFVVGHDQAQHESGLQWAKTALALARGPKADPWEEAMVLSDIGITLLKKGKLTEALGYHERALAIFEESRGAGHSDIADLLHNMGTVLRQLGKTEEALSHLRQALTIREEALGAHHPHVAHSLTTIGAVLKDQGKPDEALDNLLRALEIREDALGPDHPNVATSLNNIAILYKEQGKLEEALTHFQRALTIQEKVLGTDHPRVAYPLNNIGEVLREQGKQEEALEYFQRSLETMIKALGPDHPNVALSAINLGNLLYVQERYQDARQNYQRAYEIQQAALPKGHPHMAWSLLGLAKTDIKTRDFEDARKYAEQAVSIREGTKVPPQLLAEAQFILARVLWSDLSERPRARTLAEQARETWSSADTDDINTKEYLADVQKWLDEHVAE